MSGHDSDRFYRMQTTPESLYTMVCASSPLSERYGERRCFGSYYLRPIGVEKWLSWWSKPTVFAPGAIVEIQVVLRRFQRPLDALERLQKSNGAHLIENKNRNRFFRLFWALSDRKSMRKMIDFLAPNGRREVPKLYLLHRKLPLGCPEAILKVLAHVNASRAALDRLQNVLCVGSSLRSISPPENRFC